ncbi:histidyl-tRNA synthetase [Pyricularia oryzae 70-15]|uniref:histidine--tRNA ligase n=1 Tax=Pyricularia oryzae (strain 70-15 / ATCC MYA-4617 / FGSC 8958) TaxID=242507 RepID=G4N6G1_PYRO7|nr:histidyl-tRNA synthetase [Pyricularia oryzae 70-15]EHA49831.1 histidyl-tRNA synthetase [Pyricularia oryzae 70-15]
MQPPVCVRASIVRAVTTNKTAFSRNWNKIRRVPSKLHAITANTQQQYSLGLQTATSSSSASALYSTTSTPQSALREVPGSSQATAVMGKKDDKAGKVSFQLKTPKGTRDWSRKDMILRDRIFNAITEVFKRHGGTNLDTPVFELKEILSGKYGEDSKLIYDLADQGGELCSLRYDLTVPLARYLAMNTDIKQLKRYQIAKVYRRDQPAVAKGRMREFYQCDFDVAGIYDPMIPDAEILRIIVEVFEALNFEKFTIKINHRKVLDGLFEVSGVLSDKIRSISSAVDKLDKMPWEEVKKEMLEKGISAQVADSIGEYVKHKGGKDIVDLLKADAKLEKNENAKAGIEDMNLLFTYLDAFGVTDKVSFDLSLARGLDYYTGVIYEVVTEGSAPAVAPKPSNGETEAKVSGEGAAQPGTENAAAAPVDNKKKAPKKKQLSEDDDRSDDPTVGVGSIAAGGRYDNLVGMFSGKGDKGQIPCVGISFGVDRIFSIMSAKQAREQATVRQNEVDVYVMAFGGGKDFTGLLPERIAVARQLWDAGIKAEFSAKVKPKLQQQFKVAEDGGVPLAVILGEDELKAGKVKLKILGLPKDHPDKEGHLVSRDELAAEIKKVLSAGTP